MVSNQLVDHIKGYSVNVKEVTRESESIPESVFMEIVDSAKDLPSITVQFINDKIFAVYYLNNQFYEIPEEDLWHVLDIILKGDYVVRGTFFRKKKSIKIILGSKEILPERVHDSRVYQEVYDKLLEQFTTT